MSGAKRSSTITAERLRKELNNYIKHNKIIPLLDSIVKGGSEAKRRLFQRRQIEAVNQNEMDLRTKTEWDVEAVVRGQYSIKFNKSVTIEEAVRLFSEGDFELMNSDYQQINFERFE